MSRAVESSPESKVRFGEAWNAFWFSSQSGERVGLLRIAVGLVAVLYLAAWTFDLERFLAPGGVLTVPAVSQAVSADPLYYPWRFSLMDYLPNRSALWGFHIAAIAAAVLCMLGVAGRAMTALTLVFVLSYIHRAPILMNPVEPLLTWSLLYLCIAPNSATFSLDTMWAKGKQALGATITNNLALRLIQVHLSLHYFFVGTTQASDRTWWTGNAVWLVMAQSRTRGLDLTAIRESTFLLNGLTHLLLLMVFALAILPWNRVFRSIANWIVIPYALLVAALTGLWIYAILLVGLQIVFWSDRTLAKVSGRAST